MSVASTGRPKTKTKTESAGDARGGAHRGATRTRHASATSRGTRAAEAANDARTVIAGSGGETGQPLWEDDGGRCRRKSGREAQARPVCAI